MSVSSIGVFTTVTAGAISFLSPCVLPLVPGYMSYIAGHSGDTNRTDRVRMVLLSGSFVLGFSTVFVALGASATALSRVLRAYTFEANVIGGVIIIVFGVFMTGLVRPLWLDRDIRYHGPLSGRGPVGAYVLGLAFAFGWTPCIGPILGAILTVSAVSETASSGAILLALYSLGLGIPFLLVALFTERLVLRLQRIRRLGRSLQIGAGVAMILMGITMASGNMSRFAFWLMQQFPSLGLIG